MPQFAGAVSIDEQTAQGRRLWRGTPHSAAGTVGSHLLFYYITVQQHSKDPWNHFIAVCMLRKKAP